MTVRISRVEFLEAIFGRCFKQRESFVLVRNTSDPDALGSVKCFPNLTSLASVQFPGDQHVFFGPCPRDHAEPGKEHIRRISALWAGLDVGPNGYSGKEFHYGSVEEAMAAVDEFELKPSAVVRSGSGLHLYWLLREVKEITDPIAAEALLSKLNSHFRCPGPATIDSTLRLPGTYNRKGDQGPKLCFVESLDPELRYSGTDFQRMVAHLKNVSVGLSKTQFVPSHKPAPPAEDAIPSDEIPDARRQDSVAPVPEPEPAEAHSRGFPGEPDIPAPQKEEPAECGPPQQATPELDMDAPKTIEYELIEEEEAQLVALSKEDLRVLADMITDRLAKRFLGAFSKRLVDEIVDQAVGKLANDLSSPENKR